MSDMMQQDSDIEQLSCISSDEGLVRNQDQSPASAFARHRRTITGFVGATVLFACAAVAITRSTAGLHQHGNSALTGRSLLDCPDVHRVATENIFKTSHHVPDDDTYVRVHSVVKSTFNGLSQHLSQHSPDVARALDETPITAEQKNAVVHMMSYLSDPRVQKLGLKVAQAVRDAGSDDPEVLKRHIARKLAPHMEHMHQVSQEVFPESVRRALTGGGFEHLLEPHRIRLMKTVDDAWDTKLSMTQAAARRLIVPAWAPPASGKAEAATTPAPAQNAAPAPNVWGGPQAAGTASAPATGSRGSAYKPSSGLIKAERGMGIAGAAASEALVLLRIMKPLSKVFHNDLNVNPWVTSGIGVAASALEIATCEVNAVADGTNPAEVVSCPLEFGSECFDAMREGMTLTGVLGDNNKTNGRQGNHNDDPKVHAGIFDDEGSPSKEIFGAGE